MTDFNCSDAGQHAAYACQILAGARTLSEARPSSRYRLLLPMLNLSGHGLELLLKACIYLNGNEPPRFGQEGHNVKAMWDREDCEPVRVHVAYNAHLAVIEARAEMLYPDIPSDDEVGHLIEEYVSVLVSAISTLGTVWRDCVAEGLRLIFIPVGVEDDEEPKDRASETRDDQGPCRASREGHPACDAQVAFF